jgi:hypothetical protein
VLQQGKDKCFDKNLITQLGNNSLILNQVNFLGIGMKCGSILDMKQSNKAIPLQAWTGQ